MFGCVVAIATTITMSTNPTPDANRPATPNLDANHPAIPTLDPKQATHHGEYMWFNCGQGLCFSVLGVALGLHHGAAVTAG